MRFQFRRFDIWGKVDPQNLDGPDELKKHAVKYDPSNKAFFKKIIENLEWQFQESTFVDFGCGKGAALMYASEYGFKKLIGVEFSPNLAQSAQENLKKMADLKVGVFNFEIVNIDASLYDIPLEADCFYFYHPFDSYIMDKVMKNIVKSLETRDRKILLVYLNAVHRSVIEGYGFKTVKAYTMEDLDYNYFNGAYVYTN